MILVILGVLTSRSVVISIDNRPDFSLIDYDRHRVTDLHFDSSWNFGPKFRAIISATFGDAKILHSDNLEVISSELNLYCDDPEEMLTEALGLDEDILFNHGIEADIDGFTLHGLKINYIDNVGGLLHYKGGYLGDYSSISPMDWDVYAPLEVVAIKHNCTGHFYLDLIAESYSLFYQKNFKLSFFIAYSAIENYANNFLGSSDDAVRLKQKIKAVFENVFGSLNTHFIYTSLINDFDGYSKTRNSVAHGRSALEVSEEECFNFILFVLTMICSVEMRVDTFAGILNLIDKYPA
jgi:hypothetical protein